MSTFFHSIRRSREFCGHERRSCRVAMKHREWSSAFEPPICNLRLKCPKHAMLWNFLKKVELGHATNLTTFPCMSMAQYIRILQTIPIPVQAEKIWTWTGIIFDWMILPRIFNFLDHSQQPNIVYEVSWMNFDNVRLYQVDYVPYYLWRKGRNTESIPFEPEPGSGSFAEILGHYRSK